MKCHVHCNTNWKTFGNCCLSNICHDIDIGIHLVCLQLLYQIRDVIWIILSEVFLHFNNIIMIQKALSQLTPPVFIHTVSNQHSQSDMIVTLQSHFEFIVRLPTVSRQLKSSSHREDYILLIISCRFMKEIWLLFRWKEADMTWRCLMNWWKREVPSLWGQKRLQQSFYGCKSYFSW